jgi:hypothetical protein
MESEDCISGELLRRRGLGGDWPKSRRSRRLCGDWMVCFGQIGSEDKFRVRNEIAGNVAGASGTSTITASYRQAS